VIGYSWFELGDGRYGIVPLKYVYNLRVLRRAQVPSQYSSTSAECKARGTTYLSTGLGTCIKTEAEG
jgi:hypothetical protein